MGPSGFWGPGLGLKSLELLSPPGQSTLELRFTIPYIKIINIFRLKKEILALIPPFFHSEGFINQGVLILTQQWYIKIS